MLTTESALRKDRRNGVDITPMQHRHYAAIASVLRDIADVTCRERAVLAFVERLAVNANFDRARFIRACQP